VGLAVCVFDTRAEDVSVPVIAAVLDRPDDTDIVTVLVLVFDTKEDLEVVDDADEDFDITELSDPVADTFAVIDFLPVKLWVTEELREAVTEFVAEWDTVTVFILETDCVLDAKGLVVTDPDRVGVKDDVLVISDVLLLEGLTVLDLDI